MLGRQRRVVTWDERRLELLTGLCTLGDGGMLTVSSEYGTKSVKLEVIPPFDQARVLLRELAAGPNEQR